jgi:hypothetical protein
MHPSLTSRRSNLEYYLERRDISLSNEFEALEKVELMSILSHTCTFQQECLNLSHHVFLDVVLSAPNG